MMTDTSESLTKENNLDNMVDSTTNSTVTGSPTTPNATPDDNVSLDTATTTVSMLSNSGSTNSDDDDSLVSSNDGSTSTSSSPSNGSPPPGPPLSLMATSSSPPSSLPVVDNALRRVKLYMLNEERQWDDRGTGHVSHACVDGGGSGGEGGVCLMVRAEADSSVLLESRILPDTAYQKQQTTLIVWSEGNGGPDGTSQDLALSFQEKAGCDEIWEKICEVQGKDPSLDVTQDISDDGSGDEGDDSPLHNSGMSSADTSAASLGGGGSNNGLSSIELPSCELSSLAEIEAVIRDPSNGSAPQKERLAMAIESRNYVDSLLDLFVMCEDLEDSESLHRLYNIIRALLMMNKNSLFQALFEEKNLMRVVGALEYDPSREAAGKEREKHREFLLEKAVFHEVVPVTDESLLAKIHQTFRVQYIQEVILPTPSVFEENLLSTLNSFLFYNKVDIVKMFQEDESLLSQVFNRVSSVGTCPSDRRDLVLFLREFCTFSQTLQPADRESFFKALQTHGVLEALETVWIAASEDPHDGNDVSCYGSGNSSGFHDAGSSVSAVTRSAVADVFAFIVETNPSMVREFSLREVVQRKRERTERQLGDEEEEDDEEDLLVNVAVEQMKTDPDPELGMGVQIAATLRMLVDPENMMSNVMKTEKAEFLTFFYRHVMPSIAAPLLACTLGERPSSDTYQTAQLLSLTLDLLTFCGEHHTFHFRTYLIQRDLLRRALVLLKSSHGFLALATLRFMRRLVGLKDDTYNRYMVKGNHFRYVCEAFRTNGNKYNLLNSAIIEMFEFIRAEDIKALLAHVAESHWEAFADVTYVPTFRLLRAKHTQRQETTAVGAGSQSHSSPIITAGMRGPREGTGAMEDEEEEMWFDRDEEEFSPDGNSPLRNGGMGGISVLGGGAKRSLAAGLEEDDDEDFTEMSRLSKKARLGDDEDVSSLGRCFLKRSDSMTFNLQLKGFGSKGNETGNNRTSTPIKPQQRHSSSNLIKITPSTEEGKTLDNPITVVADSGKSSSDNSPPGMPPIGALAGLVDYSDEDSSSDDDVDAQFPVSPIPDQNKGQQSQQQSTGSIAPLGGGDQPVLTALTVPEDSGSLSMVVKSAPMEGI